MKEWECLTTPKEMDAERLQHYTSDHDHYCDGDHREGPPTKHVIEARVLQMTYQAAVIDEQQYEYQDDRGDDGSHLSEGDGGKKHRRRRRL